MIFDLVSAANIAQYWIEKNVNEQPLLGETLFPAVREIGIKLEWIKGAKNQPVGSGAFVKLDERILPLVNVLRSKPSGTLVYSSPNFVVFPDVDFEIP